MSVFGGFLGDICADYFYDEFGLPLPNYKAISTKPKDAENSEAKRGINETKNKYKNVGSSSSSSKPIALAEEPQSDALSFAPSFDGLFCFETLVSKFIKPT